MTALAAFPIVGIGASAGGLEALKVFFDGLPAGTGAAYVVIQHLDPVHESLMADILSRSTRMPVAALQDHMRPAPDHVYVIPPNTYVQMEGGDFRLIEPLLRHGMRMPIDHFLWSLAEQQEAKAVAIILSGTGSDGALGVRAVKGQGGLVMAQSPGSAQHGAMPQSAIATGVVDIVGDIATLPEILSKYFRNPVIDAVFSEKSAADGDDDKHLHSILGLLQSHTSHNFRVYKSGTVGRRVARRMGLQQISSHVEYLEFLRENDDEVGQLFRDLLIGVTAFFRDSDAFAALQKEVTRPLLARKSGDEALRVWVPGCSTGEEAYSIGILLLEQLAQCQRHNPVRIFATDISDDALSTARAGRYPLNIVANVSAERLRRFFAKEDQEYRVSKVLRDAVTFAKQNVFSDPPFSNLDLISCRNLLIYLTPEAQQRVYSLFNFALADHGMLFLGHSENISQPSGLFEPVTKKWRIFRRADAPRSLPPNLAPGRRSVAPASLTTDLPEKGPSQDQLNDLLHRRLLQAYAPAAVLVNASYQALSFSGPTGRYLVQPAGGPTQDLLSLAGHDLRVKLRAALEHAAAEKARTVVDDAVMTRDEAVTPLMIIVEPVSLPRYSQALFLVTFQDRQKAEAGGSRIIDEDVENRSLVEQLEYDLKSSREDSQSHIEEMESANEELQAANEEVMSVNEELQSTNEELETSKEELQSMNEEMSTVNLQLKDKIGELASANDDLANLLSSTDIATLFLDQDLAIGRFTPATKRLLNLLESDIGRPFEDIRPKFNDPELLSGVRRVMQTLVPLEAEIRTENGAWFARRILPYRTTGDRISGIVITFVDITDRKQSEANALRLATVVRDSNDAITVHDREGRIVAWNKGAEDSYGWPESEALQMNTADLIPPEGRPWVAEIISAADRAVRIPSFETRRLTRDGRVLDVWVTVTPLRDDNNEVQAIATTERDITEKKHKDELLRQADRRKDEFLATLAHELRNPMAAISAGIELMHMNREDSSEFAEANKIVRRQANHLTRLIDDLLDQSRINRGTLSLQKSRVDLADIIQGAVNDVRPALARAGHELTLSLNEKPLHIYADATRLSQVVFNVLENAVKYTPDGGHIRLTVAERDASVEISVKDDGMGIPADKFDDIFEIFNQIDRTSDRGFHGLGIGLFLSRWIVERHGGVITVESGATRQGSIFTVTLPLVDEPEAVSQDEHTDDENCPADERARVFRIVIVDDDVDAARGLAKLLKKLGHETRVFHKGRTAIAGIPDFEPDLVLLDIGMPGMNGYDVARHIRQQEWGSQLTLAALTGFGQESDKAAAKDAGFDHHFVKPLDLDGLQDLFRKLHRGAT